MYVSQMLASYISRHVGPWRPYEIVGSVIVVAALVGIFVYAAVRRSRGTRGSGLARGGGLPPAGDPHGPGVNHIPVFNVAGTCPNCRNPVVPGSSACPACGWNRGGPQLAWAYGLTTPCPQCHLPLSPDVATCPKCHWHIHAAAAPAEQAQQQRTGVIQHDILIGGELAFGTGERVVVEDESPDPQRPEYRYVVLSNALNKRFRLSDIDLFV